MSHEAEQREDGETREHARAAVDEGHKQRVSEAVVLELVKAGHAQQAAEAGPQRVEDLSGGVRPHLETQATWRDIFVSLQCFLLFFRCVLH